MLRAIAVDDEPLALRIIAQFCGQVDGIDLQKTFARTDEALNYVQNFPVDLLFLDINMPAMTGLEFKAMLPREALVIFTTAYSEYAVEGFNVNAVDYLLKPFTLERFRQAVQKAQEFKNYLNRSETAKPTHVFIRADYALHKIALTDILFVEGLDDYLKLHLLGNRPLVARMTMKAMQQQLPESDFVRVHRSFIVPLARIEAVRNKLIQLGDEEIPIGASYEAEFFRRFNG